MAGEATNQEELLDYVRSLTEPSSLGEVLRNACTDRNISMSEAARRIGVKRQEFSLWVNGQRQPAAHHLPRVARFLGTNVTAVRALMSGSRRDRITDLEVRVAKLTELVVEVIALTQRIEASLDTKPKAKAKRQRVS
jgi:transcriptional regulator with XRE-family HTH domain